MLTSFMQPLLSLKVSKIKLTPTMASNLALEPQSLSIALLDHKTEKEVCRTPPGSAGTLSKLLKFKKKILTVYYF